MQVIHTSYIKRMSDQTGKTYRDLEALWKKFEREVENARMFDPNKFSHMRSTDGTIAQEIARRFEEFLVNPLGVEAEDQNEEVDAAKDELVADDIENEMEEDIVSELEDDIPDVEADTEVDVPEEPVEGDIEKDVPIDEETPVEESTEESEPEINLDDFEELEDL